MGASVSDKSPEYETLKTTVTRGDVDTLKNDWLTDNVKLLTPTFPVSQLTPMIVHILLGRVRPLPPVRPSLHPTSDPSKQIPRARIPLQVPQRAHNPPPTQHVLHANPDPEPLNPSLRPPLLQTHLPHLPPHKRLPQPQHPRRRLALVIAARQRPRQRRLPLR